MIGPTPSRPMKNYKMLRNMGEYIDGSGIVKVIIQAK